MPLVIEQASAYWHLHDKTDSCGGMIDVGFAANEHCGTCITRVDAESDADPPGPEHVTPNVWLPRWADTVGSHIVWAPDRPDTAHSPKPEQSLALDEDHDTRTEPGISTTDGADTLTDGAGGRAGGTTGVTRPNVIVEFWILSHP